MLAKCAGVCLRRIHLLAGLQLCHPRQGFECSAASSGGSTPPCPSPHLLQIIVWAHSNSSSLLALAALLGLVVKATHHVATEASTVKQLGEKVGSLPSMETIRMDLKQALPSMEDIRKELERELGKLDKKLEKELGKLDKELGKLVKKLDGVEGKLGKELCSSRVQQRVEKGHVEQRPGRCPDG